MNIKKLLAGSAIGLSTVLAATMTVLAATTIVVMGNTAAGENQPGWLFNRDVSTSTPFEFNTDAASIGVGSLYVMPITNTGNGNSDKFVAENFVKTPVENLNSISYDFKIAGNGDSSDANQFYLNVYANIDNSNKFYDCRFDYVPVIGTTSGFTTASFAASDTPVNVRTSSTPRTVCPATLDGMPEGSYVRAFSISVGDTSGSDTGLAGYLDNVVVDLDSDVTTYDFEPAITPGSDKNDCKNGGWMTFNAPSFKNQGACVSYITSNEKAGKRP